MNREASCCINCLLIENQMISKICITAVMYYEEILQNIVPLLYGYEIIWFANKYCIFNKALC